MSQAKSLTDIEIKRVLMVISQGRNAARNRLMFLLSVRAGMRVGEIAALRIGDVVGSDGQIKHEIRLLAEQTKGSRPRTVYIGEKLQKEIQLYIDAINATDKAKPLIYSQKRRTGFSANTLSQEFKTLYKHAGVDGASSHSGRRTFITNLANKGIGVRVLQALAGHRSIATTQLYIDVNDEMMRTAVNLI